MLTKKELAEKLKVSEITVDRMIANGLPKIKVGRQNRFIYEDVLEYFKNNTKEV